MSKTVDIEYIAELANLPLTQEEQAELSPQLEQIVRFVEKLNGLDTTDVPPTFNVTQKVNEYREDHVTTTLTQDETLSNAPEKKDGYVVVKGVLGHDS